MAIIALKDVSVQFPVYDSNTRSLKKNFLRLATGGTVSEDNRKHVMVDALKQISFTLQDGDRVGLVGHNGSGKSTLLRLLAEIYEPTNGQLHIDGHITSLLDITHGIESDFTGSENIAMRGAMIGLTRKEIKEKTAEIAEFSGLGDYLALPLRTYSSGMRMRLGFAISTCIKPDILLIDEIFGVGDASFIDKAKQRMVSLLEQSSIVVMASHANALIENFCNKALWLEGGRIKFFGPTQVALERYAEAA